VGWGKFWQLGTAGRAARGPDLGLPWGRGATGAVSVLLLGVHCKLIENGLAFRFWKALVRPSASFIRGRPPIGGECFASLWGIRDGVSVFGSFLIPP